MLQKLDQYFGFYQSALRLRAFRQEVIGANLANADTPNYKAVDFDFKSALGAAQGVLAPVQMQSSNPAHMTGTGAVSGTANLRFRDEGQTNLDGNSVDTAQEMARYTENALHYQALLTFTTDRIKTMQQAISAP